MAGQLADQRAKQAMLQAARGYEHLARTAAARAQKPDVAPGVPPIHRVEGWLRLIKRDGHRLPAILDRHDD